MKKVSLILCTIMSICLLSGCTVTKIEEEKLRDIEYTIVKEEEQPEEVQVLIADNLEGRMQMSYVDQGMEYIIIGYGIQETSGYSIEVLEMYETENALYVRTNLLGPFSGEEVVEAPTYPYIVIRIEENEKLIVYE